MEIHIKQIDFNSNKHFFFFFLLQKKKKKKMRKWLTKLANKKYYARKAQEESDLRNALILTEYNKRYQEHNKKGKQKEFDKESMLEGISYMVSKCKLRKVRRELKKNLDEQMKHLMSQVIEMGGMDPYPLPLSLEKQLLDDDHVPTSTIEKLDKETITKARECSFSFFLIFFYFLFFIFYFIFFILFF